MSETDYREEFGEKLLCDETGECLGWVFKKTSNSRALSTIFMITYKDITSGPFYFHFDALYDCPDDKYIANINTTKNKEGEQVVRIANHINLEDSSIFKGKE